MSAKTPNPTPSRPNPPIHRPAEKPRPAPHVPRKPIHTVPKPPEK